MIIKVDVHEDFKESEWSIEPLPYGDIWIDEVVIERKTWDDAYTSWVSKRLEDQISRIIEKTDNGILVIEGKLNQSWIWRNKKNYSQIKGLQKFLNRLSVEAIPVVFTDSKEDTIRYVEMLQKRIVNKDFRV